MSDDGKCDSKCGDACDLKVCECGCGCDCDKLQKRVSALEEENDILDGRLNQLEFLFADFVFEGDDGDDDDDDDAATAEEEEAEAAEAAEAAEEAGLKGDDDDEEEEGSEDSEEDEHGGAEEETGRIDVDPRDGVMIADPAHLQRLYAQIVRNSGRNKSHKSHHRHRHH